MDLIVITAPTAEPVPVDGSGGLREHCRVVGDADDVYLESIGKAARSYVEWRTGRTFYETVFEVSAPRFPCGALVLPYAAPLQSVEWIKYTDSSGTVTTMDAADYVVNTDSMPGFILPAYGKSWPSFVPQVTAAVRVRFTAGLSPNASPLIEPEDGIKHAIKLLAGALFEYREAEIVPDKPGIQAISMRYGLEALLSRYQVSYPF